MNPSFISAAVNSQGQAAKAVILCVCRPQTAFMSVGVSKLISQKLLDQLVQVGKQEVTISLNIISCMSIYSALLPLSFSSPPAAAAFL